MRLPLYLFRSYLPTKVLCSNCSCRYIRRYTNRRTHISRDCPSPTAEAPSHKSSCQEARRLVRTYLSPNERPVNLRTLLRKNRGHSQQNFSTPGDHPPGQCCARGNYVAITLRSRDYYHCHVASGEGCPDPVHLYWRCLSLVRYCELPNRLTD